MVEGGIVMGMAGGGMVEGGIVMGMAGGGSTEGGSIAVFEGMDLEVHERWSCSHQHTCCRMIKRGHGGGGHSDGDGWRGFHRGREHSRM